MLAISFQDRFPDPTALTFANYATALTDPYFLRITLRTFSLALVVTLITAVLSYPVAWFLARSNSRWKHLVFLAVISPLMVSIIVRTIGWTIILAMRADQRAVGRARNRDRPLRLMQSFWSVVVGMVTS
jgi:putative spermidine/putrescine transport system permease protein